LVPEFGGLRRKPDQGAQQWTPRALSPAGESQNRDATGEKILGFSVEAVYYSDAF